MLAFVDLKMFIVADINQARSIHPDGHWLQGSPDLG